MLQFEHDQADFPVKSIAIPDDARFIDPIRVSGSYAPSKSRASGYSRDVFSRLVG
jgi:hypothetical protein